MAGLQQKVGITMTEFEDNLDKDATDMMALAESLKGLIIERDYQSAYFRLTVLTKMLGLMGMKVRDQVMHGVIRDMGDMLGVDFDNLDLDDEEDEEVYGNYI